MVSAFLTVHLELSEHHHIRMSQGQAPSNASHARPLARTVTVLVCSTASLVSLPTTCLRMFAWLPVLLDITQL